MKRPYLNKQERMLIHCETTTGAFLNLELAFRKLFRDVGNAIKIVVINIVN